MFAVMRVYRDEFGQTRQRRVNMREYKRMVTAQRVADENKGAYVIRVGCLEPVSLGTWQ